MRSILNYLYLGWSWDRSRVRTIVGSAVSVAAGSIPRSLKGQDSEKQVTSNELMEFFISRKVLDFLKKMSAHRPN